ncbi:peptidoglycan DD-metalloendopeptidase family protein, partial [Hymenobacter agri]
ATAGRPTAVPLSWPLRQAAGFDYTNIYGISNFVDHNAAYPNAVQDFNCGTRTYDQASGYNHAGTDIFLWPFSYNMMDSQQAEIVAAAPGIIIGKADGNYDRNCAMSNAPWNAVYVQHADGSVAWYGHMKSGSLTTKAVGASVALGERLGSVGSSGSSTGPHLHFELHSPSGAILDPYSGPCSPAATWWAAPRSYYESALNTVLLHRAAPVLNACPTPDITNESSAFVPGDRLFTAAYYHDQLAGQTTQYTIYQPNNTVFATWTHASTAAHYAASYWYWSYTLPVSAPLGQWRFEARYQGTTVSRTFTVSTTTATAAARLAAQYTLAPNPATDAVQLTGPLPVARVQVLNPLGQVVRTIDNVRQPTLDLRELGAAGLYLVRLYRPDGSVEQHKLLRQ